MIDSRTGELYSSFNDARKAYENLGMSAKKTEASMKNLVEIYGNEEAVGSISKAVKADRRRKDKATSKPCKKNRK